MRRNAEPLLLEQQRFNAARMSDLGMEPAVIAASLGFDDQTVRRWLRAYRRGGVDALRARLHPGPRPRMSEQHKREFLELLSEPPEFYRAQASIGGTLWTAAKMARLIFIRFGVSYHPSHVGQMMHELGYSQQLPQKRPRQRDDRKIKQWRDQHWPAIVQAAREQRARIAFIDEAGFLMNPLSKKVWAKVGHTPQLRHHAGNHTKVSVIGALVVDPMQPERIDLLTQWHPDRSVDQHDVIDFLQRLLSDTPSQQRLFVVWDNLPAHRSKLVKQMCFTERRLWLEALPGYAPDLNPIELVWCMSKYHRLANHDLIDLERLHQAAQQATDEIANEKTLLKSCLRHAGLAHALYPSERQ
jgi:transposase